MASRETTGPASGPASEVVRRIQQKVEVTEKRAEETHTAMVEGTEKRAEETHTAMESGLFLARNEGSH